MVDTSAASGELVPAIRFEEFSGEWEERILGEVGDLKNGMNFSKDAMGHGHPFVNLQDIFGKNVVSNNVLGLAVSSNNQRKDYSLKKGDVLFVRSSVKPSGVGEAAVVTSNLKDTTYSGFIIRFRPKLEMAVSFSRFIYSIASIRKQIIASASSSANTNINQESLQLIELKIPKLVEQTKIGLYFQQLDALIAQHQQKHDKLLNLKKSLLEKMFPKQGADEPAIRFKGFSGAWEEKELGSVCSNFQSGKFIKAEDIQKSGVYPVYGGNGLRGYSDTYNHHGTYALVGRQGALCGNMNLSLGKAFLTEHAIAVQANKNNDTIFLFYKLGGMNLGQYSGQSAQPGLSVNNLVGLSAFLPEHKEQTKIGNLFQQLDTLITQHKTQLTKLNNIKQACLAKLFV